MTVLYKPVLIKSAEQAEALDAGTVLLGTTDLWPVELSDEGLWGNDGTVLSHWDAVGRTALVPVEAEEETRDHPGIMLPTNPPRYPQQTRLVTEWEGDL